ncbi:MAG TPA: replicative DNA helicase [Butyricicoccus pullicaecorum]|nr:replicative DNA helicase [Butyricicoccus pullicaecorum]MDY2970084.1 replicative DNA helicase [Butyricicoccus pullicaecorum]HJF51797.1 replicative DNA helicase [Butyricicoccus pullicaecorum]
MVADELLARQLPQSLEAEQAVIGSMLIDPACIAEVIELLRPEDFYAEEHQRIFETIYSMFNTALKIDPVTVLDRLKAQGYYDEAGGRAYLMQLMEVTPTSANVKEYASIVRDKSMLRAIANAGAEIQNLAFSGGGSAAEVAELAEQKIYSVRQGREIKGLSPLKSVIMDLYAQLDERSRSDSDIPGLSTGFRDLDVALTGLNKSDLILVAARPGMGKTAFALNIALNAAKSSGKDVVVFQLEMSKDQLASRFLASEALLDSHKLKTGSLNQDDWIKIARATSVLAKTHLYVDDNPAITVAEIKAKCRRLGENLGLIVIDYIQLMQSGGKRSENRVQEVAEISRSLKIMAKELNVPVVCLSQLSRAAEQRADKRPMLSDLRESGAIEQDADIVMFIYRDDYYDAESDDKNVAEIILAKNRHGATGTVELQWIGQYTTFSSRDRIHS